MADDEYQRKSRDLLKHVPFLKNTIKRLQTESDKPREAQITKLKSLLEIITDPKKKLKVDALKKCEEVILKLYPKQRKGGEPKTGEKAGSSHCGMNELEPARKRLSELQELATPASPSPPPLNYPLVPPKTIPMEQIFDPASTSHNSITGDYRRHSPAQRRPTSNENMSWQRYEDVPAINTSWQRSPQPVPPPPPAIIPPQMQMGYGSSQPPPPRLWYNEEPLYQRRTDLMGTRPGTWHDTWNRPPAPYDQRPRPVPEPDYLKYKNPPPTYPDPPEISKHPSIEKKPLNTNEVPSVSGPKKREPIRISFKKSLKPKVDLSTSLTKPPLSESDLQDLLCSESNSPKDSILDSDDMDLEKLEKMRADIYKELVKSEKSEKKEKKKSSSKSPTKSPMTSPTPISHHAMKPKTSRVERVVKEQENIFGNLLSSIDGQIMDMKKDNKKPDKDKPKKDEPKKEDTKKDESKKEDTKKEELKKDTPKRDEHKKDQLKKDEPSGKLETKDKDSSSKQKDSTNKSRDSSRSKDRSSIEKSKDRPRDKSKESPSKSKEEAKSNKVHSSSSSSTSSTSSNKSETRPHSKEDPKRKESSTTHKEPHLSKDSTVKKKEPVPTSSTSKDEKDSSTCKENTDDTTKKDNTKFKEPKVCEKPPEQQIKSPSPQIKPPPKVDDNPKSILELIDLSLIEDKPKKVEVQKKVEPKTASSGRLSDKYPHKRKPSIDARPDGISKSIEDVVSMEVPAKLTDPRLRNAKSPPPPGFFARRQSCHEPGQAHQNNPPKPLYSRRQSCHVPENPFQQNEFNTFPNESNNPFHFRNDQTPNTFSSNSPMFNRPIQYNGDSSDNFMNTHNTSFGNHFPPTGNLFHSSNDNFQMGARTPGDPFLDGSRTPADPFQAGGRTPGDPFQAGSRTPGDPFHSGPRTPVDPFQGGPRTPGDPFHSGPRPTGDPFQAGARTPADPFQGGGRTPGDPFQAGPRTPGDPFQAGSRTPGDPFQAGSRTPGDPFHSGARTPGDLFPAGPRTPGDPFHSAPRTPGDVFQGGSRTPGDPFHSGPRTPGDPFQGGSRAPGDPFHSGPRTPMDSFQSPMMQGPKNNFQNMNRPNMNNFPYQNQFNQTSPNQFNQPNIRAPAHSPNQFNQPNQFWNRNNQSPNDPFPMHNQYPPQQGGHNNFVPNPPMMPPNQMNQPNFPGQQMSPNYPGPQSGQHFPNMGPMDKNFEHSNQYDLCKMPPVDFYEHTQDMSKGDKSDKRSMMDSNCDYPNNRSFRGRGPFSRGNFRGRGSFNNRYSRYHGEEQKPFDRKYDDHDSDQTFEHRDSEKPHEEIYSPLDSLYSTENKKVGKGYGIQKFKIPKIRRHTTDEAAKDDKKKEIIVPKEEVPAQEETDVEKVKEIVEDDGKKKKEKEEIINKPEKKETEELIEVQKSENSVENEVEVIAIKGELAEDADKAKTEVKAEKSNKEDAETEVVDADKVQAGKSETEEKVEMFNAFMKQMLSTWDRKVMRQFFEKMGISLPTQKKKKFRRVIDSDSEESDDEHKDDPSKSSANETDETVSTGKETDKSSDQIDKPEGSVVETVGERIKSRKRQTSATKLNSSHSSAKDTDDEDKKKEEADEKKTKKGPKPKRRNALELLQDDLREMFICEGVLTATGQRMCRMMKEHQDSVMKSELQGKISDDDFDEEDNIPLRSRKFLARNSKTVKPVKPETSKLQSAVVVLDQTDVSKFTHQEPEKSVGSEDEGSKRSVSKTRRVEPQSPLKRQPGPKSKRRKIDSSMESLLDAEDDVSSIASVSVKDKSDFEVEESADEFMDKPVKKQVKKKGKRRNWAMGVIKKKPASKAKISSSSAPATETCDTVSTSQNEESINQNDESINQNEELVSHDEVAGKPKPKETDELVPENKEIGTDKEAEKNNTKTVLDTEEYSLVTLDTTPDINYYLSNAKSYDCKLCNFSGKFVVNHYRTKHPEAETMISRLSPAQAESAKLQARTLGFDSIVPFEETIDGKRRRTHYLCRFCSLALRDESAMNFFDHLCSHTGEYRFQCTQCSYYTPLKKTLSAHYYTAHPHFRRTDVDVLPTFESPPNFRLVFGYLCLACNFVQLLESNMEKHIRVSHPEQTIDILKISLSSRPVPIEDLLNEPSSPVKDKTEQKASIEKKTTKKSEKIIQDVEKPRKPISAAETSKLDVETSILETDETKKVVETGKVVETSKVIETNQLVETSKVVETNKVIETPKEPDMTVFMVSEDVTEREKLIEDERIKKMQEVISNISPRRSQLQFVDKLKDKLASVLTDDEEEPEGGDINEQDTTIPAQSTANETGDKWIEIVNTCSLAGLDSDEAEHVETVSSTPQVEEAEQMEEEEGISEERIVDEPRQSAELEQDSESFGEETIDVAAVELNLPVDSKQKGVLNTIQRLAAKLQTPSTPVEQDQQPVQQAPELDTQSNVEVQTIDGVSIYKCLEPGCDVVATSKDSCMLHRSQDHTDPDTQQDKTELVNESKSNSETAKIRIRRISGDILSTNNTVPESQKHPPNTLASLFQISDVRTLTPEEENILAPDVEAPPISSTLPVAAPASPVVTSQMIQLTPGRYQIVCNTSPNMLVSVGNTTGQNVLKVCTAKTGEIKGSIRKLDIVSSLQKVPGFVGMKPFLPAPGQVAVPVTIAMPGTGAITKMVSVAGTVSVPKVSPKPIAIRPAVPTHQATLIPALTASNATSIVSTSPTNSTPKLVIASNTAKQKQIVLANANQSGVPPNDVVMKKLDIMLRMIELDKIVDLYKCPMFKCDFTDNRREPFEKHITIHKIVTSAKLCVYCNESLQYSNLVKHVNQQHGHCFYQCQFCFYRGACLSYVASHTRTHHGEFKKLIKLVPNLKKSMDTKHLQTYVIPKKWAIPPLPCPDESCQDVYVAMAEFMVHMATNHRTIVRCSWCGSIENNAKALVRHYSKHGIGLYQCRYCVYGTSLNLDMLDHYSRSHFNLEPIAYLRRYIRKIDKCSQSYENKLDALEEINMQKNLNVGDLQVTTIPIDVQALTTCEKSSISEPLMSVDVDAEEAVDETANDDEPAVDPLLIVEPEPSLTTNTPPPALTNTTQTLTSTISSSQETITLYSSDFNNGSSVIIPKPVQDASDALIIPNSIGLQTSGSFVMKTPDISRKRTPNSGSTIRGLHDDVFDMIKLNKNAISRTYQTKTKAGSTPSLQLDEQQQKTTEKQQDPLDLSLVNSNQDESEPSCSNKSNNAAVELSGQNYKEPEVILEEGEDDEEVHVEDEESDKPRLSLTGRELYRCGTENCTFSAVNKKDFRDHMNRCCVNIDGEKLYKCVHCGSCFKFRSGFLEHIHTHAARRYSCSLCRTTLNKNHLIEKHMRYKHKIPAVRIEPVEPGKTNHDVDFFVAMPVGAVTTIETARALEAANDEKIEKAHAYGPDDLDNLPRQPVYSQQVHCKLCMYSTKVRSNLLRHLQAHVAEKAVPQTAPVNPVPCLEKNEKMFDKMTNLAASSHTGRMGGKTTAPAATPDEIVKPEFVPASKRFVCGADGCNYLTHNEAMLKYHLTALHLDEKSYKCPHCQVQLRTETESLFIDNILKHLKMHDLNLYKCTHCHYMHYQKSKIDKHLSDKHPDRIPYITVIREYELSANDDHKPETPDVKEAKPWRCGLCSYQTQNRANVQKHVANIHAIKSQFKCGICNFKCSAKNNYANHFRTRHPNSDVKIISVYFKVNEKDEEAPVEPPLESDNFDTTPLWSRDKPRIRHIRGILLDETTKSSKKAPKSEKNQLDKTLPSEKSSPEKKSSAKPSRASLEKTNTVQSGSETKFEIGSTVTDFVLTETFTIDDSDDESTAPEHIQPTKQEPDLEMQLPDTYGAPRLDEYVCPFCSDFSNSSLKEFIEHLSVELNYYRCMCNYCGFKAVNLSQARKHHIKNHNDEETSLIPFAPKPKFEDWIDKCVQYQQNQIKKIKSEQPEEIVLNSAETSKQETKSRPTRSTIDKESPAMTIPADKTKNSVGETLNAAEDIVFSVGTAISGFGTKATVGKIAGVGKRASGVGKTTGVGKITRGVGKSTGVSKTTGVGKTTGTGKTSGAGKTTSVGKRTTGVGKTTTDIGEISSSADKTTQNVGETTLNSGETTLNSGETTLNSGETSSFGETTSFSETSFNETTGVGETSFGETTVVGEKTTLSVGKITSVDKTISGVDSNTTGVVPTTSGANTTSALDLTTSNASTTVVDSTISSVGTTTVVTSSVGSATPTPGLGTSDLGSETSDLGTTTSDIDTISGVDTITSGPSTTRSDVNTVSDSNTTTPDVGKTAGVNITTIKSGLVRTTSSRKSSLSITPIEVPTTSNDVPTTSGRTTRKSVSSPHITSGAASPTPLETSTLDEQDSFTNEDLYLEENSLLEVNKQLMEGVEQHLVTSDNESSLQCEHCMFIAKTQQTLKKHLKRHFMHKPYRCTYCGFTAFHDVLIKTHVASKHADLDMKYDIIPEPIQPTFRPLRQKRMHGTTSPNVPVKIPREELYLYNCYYCPKRSDSVEIIKSHILESHGKSHKNVFKYKKLVLDNSSRIAASCRYCMWTGSEAAALKQHHAEQHSDMHLVVDKSLRYICGLCPEAYAKVIDLKKHFTAVHPKDVLSYRMQIDGEERTVERVEVVEEPIVKTELIPFLCDICQKNFENAETLQEHLKSMHPRTQLQIPAPDTDMKKFKCPVCEHTSNSYPAMREHVRAHSKPFKCKYCPFIGSYPSVIKTHHNKEHKTLKFEYETNAEAKRLDDALRDKLLVLSPDGIYQCKTPGIKRRLSEAEESSPNKVIVLQQSPEEPPEKPSAAPRLNIARKSTTKPPFSLNEGYSYYGTKPCNIDTYKNVISEINIMGTSRTINVVAMSHVLNLFPVVLVEDINKKQAI